MKTKLITICSILLSIAIINADEFDPDSIKSLMRKATYWGYNNLDGDGASTLMRDWSRGTFMTGSMGTYRVTGEQEYLDSAVVWGDAWSWEPEGSGTHPDAMCCMQTYCEAFIVDSSEENRYRYVPSKNVIDTRLEQPTNGADWFYWEDGLYMGPPVISMLGYITQETSYWDSVTAIILDCRDNLYDTEYNMWYWRNDPEFKTTPEGNPEFWGPGNAWVIGGLIRCIKYMNEDYAQRSEWITLFTRLCEALSTRQQDDGFWRTSLYEPTEFPDPESSCTSFFTYAMCLGMVYGLLDMETYKPIVDKAWSALVTCVDENGRVGRCQPWSLAPGGVPETHNTPEGQGAFLLAAEGIYTLYENLTDISYNSLKKNVFSNGICGKKRGRMMFKVSHKTPYSLKVPENAKGYSVYLFNGRKIDRKLFGRRNEKQTTVSFPKSSMPCYIRFIYR